jgi:hypothetical protein
MESTSHGSNCGIIKSWIKSWNYQVMESSNRGNHQVMDQIVEIVKSWIKMWNHQVMESSSHGSNHGIIKSWDH